MTLIDPTGGVGYSTGQRLPSADMTTIATQQPDAVDGVGGGTYTGNVDLDNFEGRVRTGNEITVDNGGAVRWDGSTKTHLPTCTSRTYTYNVPLFGPLANLSTRFAFNTSGAIDATGFQWEQQDVTDAGRLVFMFAPPMSFETTVSLSFVVLYVSGGGASHGGTKPTTMPRMRVGAKRSGDWTGAVGASHGVVASDLTGWVTDSSANATEYETPHGISALGINDNPKISGSLADPSGTYYVIQIEGESGGTATANAFIIGGLEVGWTMTQLGT